MSHAFQRELSIWADFNSTDDQRRITTSLRFAATPERPIKGELVRLHDDEGNTVLGIVEQLDGMTLHVRPELTTWSSVDLSLGSPFISDAPFQPRPPQLQPT